MAKARLTKYINHVCEQCARTTKFELLGDVAGEEGKRWAKCGRCHHTTMLDMEVILGERKNVREINVAMEDCIPYSPKNIYTVGDAIYHKTWDDVGTVVSKELATNGAQAIVVAFAKIGEKRLIENVV